MKEQNWKRKEYESWDEAFRGLSPVIRQQSVRVAAYTQALFVEACKLQFGTNTEAGEAIVSADGAEACRRPIGTAPNGLCYLHIRTLAETGDCAGTYIKELLFDGE